MASFQQEIDAINAKCRQVADAEEAKLIDAAILASIKLAADKEYQVAQEKQLAADRLEWLRMHAGRTRVSEKKDATGRECKSYAVLSNDYVYESLCPMANEIKLKCPWCGVPQLMEVNCGIAHCGFRYVAGKLEQLPPHGKPNEFAGKSFVVGGCGKQFMYIRNSKEVEKSCGL